MRGTLAYGLITLLIACHGTADRSLRDALAGPVTSSVADAALDAGPPPRCTLVANAHAVAFGEGAELGEAVAIPGGFAVGLLRARDGGRGASVVRLGTGDPVTTDLGLVARDAPAPQPIVRAGELYAVAYTTSAPVRPAHPAAGGDPHATRSLSVFHVGAATERLAVLPSETDRSMAYDVVAAPAATSPVGAVIAWDDEVGTPPHGVVRLASLTPDLRAVRATSVVQVAPSAAESKTETVDAGDPRLVALDGGYWLTYIARRPENAKSTLPLPAGEIETPSEEATYGWIEGIALDAEGTPKGAARRLSAVTGHVVSYAVWSHDAVLEVIAKDDGKAALGGSLERIVWKGDGEPERHALVRSGVEEELPPVVVPDVGALAWLSFLDVKGETELLPLAPLPPGTPSAAPKPTHEPLLAGGRILGVAVPQLAPGRLALAVANGAAWSLTWAACVP
jgi:hypothetical protein